MKIALATIHARDSLSFTPLALLYLKTYLLQYNGCASDDVHILEFTQRADLDEAVRRVLDVEPAVVGLSCYVWNINQLMVVARRVKDVRPDIHIVLGGPEVGAIASSVLEANPQIDVIVKSEGEVPFSQLVAAWKERRGIDRVSGICFRRGAAIIETEDAPALENLNHLPSPHVPDLVNHGRRTICLETQRGCVFRCSFCFYNKDFSVRNRRFDLDRVKRELLFWLAQDVREIYLMDPIFNLDAERAKEICRFVIRHNHRRIPLRTEVWAEFIDEEMARLLGDANFHFLEVGLQTTDTTALAAVERRLRLPRFVEGIRYLKQFNLKFEMQLIYGLPGETPASFRRSLNFAGSLDPYSLAVYRLMILPGTELRRSASELSLAYDPKPPYYVRSHLSMNSADIEHGDKLVDALDFLGNSRTIRFLGREPGVTFADVIDAWIDWQQSRAVSDPTGDDVRQFIVDFCDERQIPSAFYQASVTREFQDEQARTP